MSNLYSTGLIPIYDGNKVPFGQYGQRSLTSNHSSAFYDYHTESTVHLFWKSVHSTRNCGLLVALPWIMLYPLL